MDILPSQNLSVYTDSLYPSAKRSVYTNENIPSVYISSVYTDRFADEICSLSGNIQRRGDVRRFYQRIQTEITVQWRGTIADGITDGISPSVIPLVKAIIYPPFRWHSLSLFFFFHISPLPSQTAANHPS